MKNIFKKIHYLFFPPPKKYSSLYSLIDFPKLQQTLSYSIINKDIFVQALLHSSFIPPAPIPDFQSNERFEFIGDAVLDLVVGEYVFLQHTSVDEGKLTVLRSQLVNRKALIYYAKELHLHNFLLIVPNGTNEKGLETILGDTFEAIIAAIYLDGGLEKAKKFISHQIHKALENGFLNLVERNFKSELLEITQAQKKGIPRYVFVNEEGPEHDKIFTMEVFIGNTSYGIGTGKNKKEAEQFAAKEALARLTQ